LLLEHKPSGVAVDISFAALPFEQEMIEEAIVCDVTSFQVSVARPVDLVIMKAVAMRSKDTLDIERILDLYPDLDVARVRRWVAEFAAVLGIPEMLSSLERTLQRKT
jgi:hypothetical protein